METKKKESVIDEIVQKIVEDSRNYIIYNEIEDEKEIEKVIKKVITIFYFSDEQGAEHKETADLIDLCFRESKKKYFEIYSVDDSK